MTGTVSISRIEFLSAKDEMAQRALIEEKASRELGEDMGLTVSATVYPIMASQANVTEVSVIYNPSQEILEIAMRPGNIKKDDPFDAGRRRGIKALLNGLRLLLLNEFIIPSINSA